MLVGSARGEPNAGANCGPIRLRAIGASERGARPGCRWPMVIDLQGIDCQIGVLPDGCGQVDVFTMLSKQQEYRRDE